MERESFLSPEIAERLNSSFVPIKVDREERPDLDALYMNYVEATTGSGGWPLNVFLTPELQPVFGGTYFPGPNGVSTPSENGEAVSFAQVLERMQDVWTTQEQKCRSSAQEATNQLKARAEEGVHNPDHQPELDLDLLDEAFRTMKHSFDNINGGFGVAPKFPVPMKLQFLLNLGQWPAPIKDIVGQSATEAATMALTTMKKIARSGIRDHVGYGISRYSVTADWSLPHFEKMLSDQALLLDTYLDAFILTHDAELLGVVYDLSKYLTTAPIRRHGGGFFSSEDADSAPSTTDIEKREGAFYVWTQKELNSVLEGDKPDVVARFYGVKADGNISREHDPHDEFLQQNTLSITTTPGQLSSGLGISESEVVSLLRDARTKLREHREKERPRPRLDDKIIASWNGLAIAALARASASLGSLDPSAAKDWLQAALDAAKFIKGSMWDEHDGILWRIWREGCGSTKGLADDYAGMIHGALELYAATFDVDWLRWADELMKAQMKIFWAETGGFYTSPASDAKSGKKSDLLLRLKTGMDGAEPSANALSAMNLCKLSSLLDDKEYERCARKLVAAFEPEIDQFPASFPGLLKALAWLSIGPKAIRLEGPDGAPGQGPGLTLSDTLARLRSQTGVARTVLRLSGAENEAWLRERRAPRFKVTVYEKRRYKEVRSLKEL